MPGSGSPVACGTDISGTGFKTTFGYTLATHTITVTQGVQQRTFQTDWLGRPMSVTEPESGTTTYSYAYNSTGLQVTRNRPKANQTYSSVPTTTTTQYDSLGRVVSISYNDGTPTKSFTYDATVSWSSPIQANLKGRLSTAAVSNGITIYSYDAMGRVTALGECVPSNCGSSNYTLSYTYDLSGNLLTSTDGAGVTSTYTVSPANEVLSLTSSRNDSTDPANLVSNVLNGPNGPNGYLLGNGLSGGYSYDSLGRSNGGWVRQGGNPLSCPSIGKGYIFSNSWKGDHLTKSFDSVLGQTSTYGYDEFDRLTSRTVTKGTVQNFSWVYDRWGNRAQQNVTAGTGPAPQFSFNTATNQITGYSYDAAGNMTNDGSHSYTYDAEGNITAVDGGTTAQYVYDALNHRVRTLVGSATTDFLFNAAGQRVSEWNGTTHAQLKGHYYLGGKPVAFYASGATHFQHQDWLGTERMRTTYNGTVEGTFTSLPFGDAQNTTSGTDGERR
jgi:YD repeat-containing protein